MDIVYTFRQDLQALNTQLKYSLRSVEKHFTGIGQVFVIGADPYLTNVTHIQFEDKFSPARNIWLKLLRAAHHPDISEDFLYMADDHFILQDCETRRFPYYVNGNLKDLAPTQRNGYKTIVDNTIKTLVSKGWRTLNFNVHAPIRYNKTKLRMLATLYPDLPPLGVVTKSLYMNTFEHDFRFTTFEPLKDCKIRSNIPLEEMRKKIEGRPVFSTGKESDSPNITALLKELYPNKSDYEN